MRARRGLVEGARGGPGARLAVADDDEGEAGGDLPRLPLCVRARGGERDRGKVKDKRMRRRRRRARGGSRITA